MPTPKLITLDAWAAATYGDAAPGLATLRRWAREGRILPRPAKHGRAYFVTPDATYVAPYAAAQPRRLVERMGESSGRRKR